MPDACTAYSGNNYSTAVDWGATNCTSTSVVWTAWATASASSISTNVWVEWTGATVGFNECITGGISDNVAHKEYEAKREAARARAKEILQRHLTEEQRAQLARDQFFVVRGSAGKEYRVKQGRAGNVEMLSEQGQAVERLCCHPGIDCPDEDTMLVQKLALETDEETFRQVANVTRLVA
jgi:hypothetical protein